MARLFEWQKQYSVGDAEIDCEHQRLFGHADDLHRAMLEGHGKQVIEKLLRALADYTATHFRHEEEWMRRVCYPELPQHREQHERFRKRIDDLSDRSHRSDNTMTIEVMQFLADWLKHHIAESDQKVAVYRTAHARG